jgi:hypothetical protein
MLYHPHVLRKYFRTMGGEINVDATEQLMGHRGYLTGEYRDIAESKLAEFYLRLEPIIAIFSNTEEVMKIKEEENHLQVIMNSLLSENQEFKRKFSETDKLLSEVLLSLEQLKSQA